jgi:hypothetical protein
MTRLFTITPLVFCLIISITAHPNNTQQLNTDDGILGQKIKVKLNNVTLMNALSTLSVIHRVPIGIEYSSADQNEPKLVLEVENGSVQEILDSIIEQEPLYRWELVDGVINFVPVRDRDPFFKELLRTSVASFNPGEWTIKFQLRDAIGEAPEVKRLLKSRNVTLSKYGDYAYSPSVYTKREVDLSASNTTVRGILNRIVKNSEHKHWAIGWRKGQNSVFAIWL